MGLLDSITSDPQAQQGLLQMGLALMANPSTQPGFRGLLESIGNAGPVGLKAMQGYGDQQHQAKVREQQLAEFARQKVMQQRQDQQYQQEQTLQNLPGQFARNATQMGNAATVAQTGGLAPTLQNAQIQSANAQPGFDLAGLSGRLLATPGGFAQGLNLQQSLKKDTSPVKVSANERLMVPDGKGGFREAVGAVSDGAKTPASVQEYLFAVGQGYRGTYENWDTERRKAGAVSVNQFGSPVAGVDPKTKEPVFFQTDKTGRMQVVPGVRPKAAAEDQPNESERTAGFLLQRLRDSKRQLEAAIKEVPSAAGPGLAQEMARKTPGIGEVVANSMTGQARQRVEAAQLDILDAALTLGTGAAYTKEQLLGYRKSYFPQLEDDLETKKDKAARLNNLLRAAEVKAGRSAKDRAQATQEGDPLGLR